MNSVVRARVSEQVKEEASEVLAGMGLTVSDAVRILLTRVAKERALPFDLGPNQETADSLRKSQSGEDIHFADDLDDLFNQLGI
jgi:DNA-damage-inducible protein J